MKAKALIAGALAVAAILVPAGTASAHNTRATWTAQEAANALVDSGLTWNTGRETVTYAECIGRGRVFYGNGFKHFLCYVETVQDPAPYLVKVHVRSGTNASVQFLDYYEG